MPQGQESRDEKSKRFVNEDGLITYENGESPIIEITDAQPINPFKSTFSVAEQTPLPAIEKPDIPEPEVSVTAGDIMPVIPNILSKVIFMKDLKTTAVGLIGFLFVTFGEYVQSGQPITFGRVATGLALAAIGWFAGDKKK